MRYDRHEYQLQACHQANRAADLRALEIIQANRAHLVAMRNRPSTITANNIVPALVVGCLLALSLLAFVV